MLSITEIREHLPNDWSDEACIEFYGWFHDFIEGMLDIVDKYSEKQ